MNKRDKKKIKAAFNSKLSKLSIFGAHIIYNDTGKKMKNFGTCPFVKIM